jgi:hypothetical protein
VVWIGVLVACAVLWLFGHDAWRGLPRQRWRGKTRTRRRPESAPAISARWLLAECPRLASTGATWPGIVAAVNPTHDSEVDALLGRLRAAHDGVIADVLRSIEDGCRLALAQNAEAGGFDALTEAARKNPWTSEARW